MDAASAARELAAGVERLVTRGAASAGGGVLGATFYVVGRARRGSKALHPRGHVLMGTLRRFGVAPPTGVGWLDEPGGDEVLVRLSRAIGLPRGWPDVLGLALRVPTEATQYGDLLFATTGTGPVSRFVLRPTVAEPLEAAYTTYLPYRTPGGAVLFAARPDRLLGRTLQLDWARPTGDWRPFASLKLAAAPTGDAEGPLVSFDPVVNTIPGLEPPEWHRRLRRYAYAAARRARGATGRPGG